MKIILSLVLLVSCNSGPFAKKNPKKVIETSVFLDRIEQSLTYNYCPRALAKYIDGNGRFHGCDSALFAGLLGIACDGVDMTQFEKLDSPGQVCRTWDCDCYLPATETDNGSDSQYSKDMNSGVQLNMAIRRDQPEFVERIVSYLQENSLVMCEAIDTPTKIGKCILPPDSMIHWLDLLEALKGNPIPDNNLYPSALTRSGYERHLAVLEVLKEGEIYGAISDYSLSILREQFKAQPENVLYSAAYSLYASGDMRAPAREWLAQCPENRLPNNHQDYCTDYKYQRDNGQDWEACPDEAFKEHPGVDCAFAAWLILHNIEI